MEYVRLLQCLDCLTIEKVLDYVGNPLYDREMDKTVSKHRFPNGEPHMGNVFRVEAAKVDHMETRTAIEKEMWGAKAEMASWKDQYTEDAGNCFNAHGRPDRCPDFHSPEKLLSSPSDQNPRATKVYVCDFCPIRSVEESRYNQKQLFLPTLRKRKNRDKRGIIS